ncbi:hypothetical protein [Phascolarctobacterium sp.]|uniref:hypothetical protein n=1 Tax=Phascolarctobacterium sp. TaxID=2049039 RepID=UPI0038668B79
MLLTIIGVLLAVIVLGVLVVALYIMVQGDAQMRLLTKKRGAVTKAGEQEGRVDFQLEVPFDNIGKQEGTILDAYMRIYLPQEQYDDVLLRGKVNLEGVMRDDDYFEALLVPAGTGKKLVLRFEAYAKNGKTIKEALSNIPDVDVALFADCRGRRELYTVKEYLTLTAEEMRELVK